MPRKKREGGGPRVEGDGATNATPEQSESRSRAGGVGVQYAGFEADRRWGGVSSVKRTSKGRSSKNDLSVALTLHSTCRSDGVTLAIVLPSMILSIIQLTAGTPALGFTIF
jgi:hypothetical protein